MARAIAGPSAHQKGDRVVIALYDYIAQDSDELSFRKGDRMLILYYSDSDWAQARHIDTKKEGYIRRNFVASEKSIEVEEWFVGKISRHDAEKLLLHSKYKRGTFLVRRSNHPNAVPGAYALSIKDWDKQRGFYVNHYRIKSLDNGEVFITTRHTFKTLRELVEFYASEAHGLSFRLMNPCHRPKPQLWDLSLKLRDKWEIDPSELTFGKKIGSGKFGEVYYGKWRGTTEVAIKTLKKGAVMSTRAFLREASIMKTFRHDKIISLYAVCSIREPIYIVTEYMSNGSLLDYLRTKDGKKLTLVPLIDFAAQVASGMMYLEGKQLVHRDLAARNILVGDNHNLKIADFGMAKILHDHEYTSAKGSRFPIKWTAPEAIFHRRYTTKSDVWSYGIVLMEIFTYGLSPYQGMNNHELIEKLQQGYRMPKPKHFKFPDVIYRAMLKCWELDPDDRPTFKSLFIYFDDFTPHGEPGYHDS